MRNAYQEYSRLRTEILRGLRAADEAHDDGHLSADAYSKILQASAEQLGVPLDLDALHAAQECPIHVHVAVSCPWLAGLTRVRPATWLHRDPQRLALLCFARGVAEVGTGYGYDCGTCCYEIEGLPPFVALEWIDQDGEPRAAVLAHEHVGGLIYE